MKLAQELSLPVVIHEREAHEDGLRIVSDFPDVTGVFHCFSGSYEMAKELVKRGWYIGFTGVVTFKNARKAVEVAEKIPPVSYTHLDVYKRQVFHGAKRRLASLSSLAGDSPPASSAWPAAVYPP